MNNSESFKAGLQLGHTPPNKTCNHCGEKSITDTDFIYRPCSCEKSRPDYMFIAPVESTITPEDIDKHLAKVKKKHRKEYDACDNCHDESYPTKYAHYTYFDEDQPTWTCFKHLDKTRKFCGILNVEWSYNLRRDCNKDNNE